MEQTARHVVFFGRVQGVGFRYTTRRIAERHNLTGWVKNMPDGTVEALLQGTESEIQGCLDDLSQDFSGYLRNTNITPVPFNPRYTGFGITF
jgi:acylphosphatase